MDSKARDYFTSREVFPEPAGRKGVGGPTPLTSAQRVARFWGRVKVDPGGCWLWTGATFRNGYGMVNCGRDADGRQLTGHAHRIAYLLTTGPIPGGLEIIHACDVKRCVCPAHLSVGTRSDNMQDASRKGRCQVPHRRLDLPAELREELIAAALSGPRGTLYRLCRDRGLTDREYRTLTTAVWYRRQRLHRTQRAVA